VAASGSDAVGARLLSRFNVRQPTSIDFGMGHSLAIALFSPALLMNGEAA
jgi:hypothetical protein